MRLLTSGQENSGSTNVLVMNPAAMSDLSAAGGNDREYESDIVRVVSCRCEHCLDLYTKMLGILRHFTDRSVEIGARQS